MAALNFRKSVQCFATLRWESPYRIKKLERRLQLSQIVHAVWPHTPFLSLHK